VRELLALLRAPRGGVSSVLARGRLSVALAGVLVATALAAASSARFASEVRVQDVVFGPGRSPLVGALIGALGVDLTAAVVYTLERSFGLLVLASAFTPLFIWILGATAVHLAAARLRGSRARFGPYLTLFGYATALSRIPAEGAALLLGGGGALGAQAVQLVGLVALAWLAFVAWHGVVLHYAVGGERAATILALALLLFYLVPLALIVLAVAAVVTAAVWLGIFSGP